MNIGGPKAGETRAVALPLFSSPLPHGGGEVARAERVTERGTLARKKNGRRMELRTEGLRRAGAASPPVPHPAPLSPAPSRASRAPPLPQRSLGERKELANVLILF